MMEKQKNGRLFKPLHNGGQKNGHRFNIHHDGAQKKIAHFEDVLL